MKKLKKPHLTDWIITSVSLPPIIGTISLQQLPPAIYKLMLGFKSLKTAYATIKSIEVIRVLRKSQAEAWYYGSARGEVGLVERVFGLGKEISTIASGKFNLQILLSAVPDGVLFHRVIVLFWHRNK